MRRFNSLDKTFTKNDSPPEGWIHIGREWELELAGKVQNAGDSGALMTAMREAFSRGDVEETLAAFEQLALLGRIPRNMRVEATCLAARALVARKERPAARALLKPLLNEDYTKPIHYDFLAHAFLDLRNYREAARLCERAGELQEAQKEK